MVWNQTVPVSRVEVVLRARLLTGGLAHLGELDRQRPKRRRAPAHDVLEGIGEFLVAIPLPLAQPIDEPVDRVRIARRSP
jgi:hypothetical protein